jgi:spore cortex formation protein SpoVR/YcgB (stage V sporulation)
MQIVLNFFYSVFIVSNDNEIEFSEFLDDKKKDFILVKIMFSEDHSKVIEFVIIYFTIIGEKPVEIVKYDVSRKESLNVHYYYQKPAKKIFLKKEVNFETVEEILDLIKRNWTKMKIKYEE